MYTPDMCIRCKATRMLCGLQKCPILANIIFKAEYYKRIEKTVSGHGKDVIITPLNYPEVKAGPMVVESEILSPKKMIEKDYLTLVKEFSTHLRSFKKTDVKSHLEEKFAEVALSLNYPEIEVEYYSKPKAVMSFSSYLQPLGASGLIKDLRICENPKIPSLVEDLSRDRVPSANALRELAHKGFDNYYMTQVLSTGMLGSQKNRKVVPTRWAITAVDDFLGKLYLNEIRNYPETSEIFSFYSGALHNEFIIVLFPGKWEFEQFEIYKPKTIWTKNSVIDHFTYDHEPTIGKKDYSIQGGGYYASRLGVCEYLKSLQRQAKAIVLRVINSGYMFPLGVWQVRENVRKALTQKPIKHQTLEEAISYIKQRLNIAILPIIRKSRILNQTKLSDFFI